MSKKKNFTEWNAMPMSATVRNKNIGIQIIGILPETDSKTKKHKNKKRTLFNLLPLDFLETTHDIIRGISHWEFFCSHGMNQHHQKTRTMNQSPYELVILKIMLTLVTVQ